MKKLCMTSTELSKYFRYDDGDGELYWNNDIPHDGMSPQGYGSWKKVSAGRVAGTVDVSGKRIIRSRKIVYQAARIVIALTSGSIGPESDVTFADGNPLNLRKDNLVLVPRGFKKTAKRKNPKRKLDSANIKRSDFEQQILYNPETGVMRWKHDAPPGMRDEIAHRSWKTTTAGKPIESIDKDGYIIAYYCGKRFPAHRIAIALYHGEISGDSDVDHINGDRSDNRISNLRVVNRQTNARNARLRSDNTSGQVGVYWRKDISKWCAQGGVDGRVVPIGTFQKYEDAVNARKAWQDNTGGFTERHGS